MTQPMGQQVFVHTSSLAEGTAMIKDASISLVKQFNPLFNADCKKTENRRISGAI
jgi:hypothetical protein